MAVDKYYNVSGTANVSRELVPPPDEPSKWGKFTAGFGESKTPFGELRWWGKAGRVLQMPAGLVYTMVEAAGKNIGYTIKGQPGKISETTGSAIKQFGRTLSLQEQHSFQEVFYENPASIGYQNPIGVAAGLAGDVVLDPTTYVTGGLTKQGRTAKSLAGLDEELKLALAAGEDVSSIVIKIDSRVGQAASKLHQAGKPTRLLATGVEQAAAGQKGIKFAGRAFPTWLNVGWEKMKVFMGKGVEATHVPKYIRKVFVTSTGNKVADSVETMSRNTINYRNSLIANRVKNVMPLYDELPEASKVIVTRALEDGNLITKLASKEKTVYDRLIVFKDMLTNLRNKGYLDDILQDSPKVIDDWFPHVVKQSDAKPFFGGSTKVHGVPTSVDATRNIDRLVPVTNKSGQAIDDIYDVRQFTKHIYADEVAKIEKAAQRKIRILETKRNALKSLIESPGAKTKIAAIDKQILNIQSGITDDIAKLPKADTFYSKTFQVAGDVAPSGKVTAEIGETGKGKSVTDFFTRERAGVFEVNEWINKVNLTAAPNEKMALFETNPVVAYAQRGMDISKGVTAQEYITGMRQFGKTLDDAPANWHTVTLKDGKMIQGLEDMRFSPEMAANINRVYEGWKPESLSKVMDIVNVTGKWWRSQALVSPAYHFRNFISNKWSNYLADVNPKFYKMAMDVQMGKQIKPFVDDFGRVWTTDLIIDAARKHGVLNLGQTAQEVTEDYMKALTQSRLSKVNPLNTENVLFRANRHVGTAIENNDRLAHFMSKLQGGDSVTSAAASVKKYLFDYADLTDIEKKYIKNATLFYTWTRKNIPLQFKELTQQPGKFSALFKVKTAVETAAGPAPNEEFLSEYVKYNAPIRLRTNEDGTTEYFLLGNWIPPAQAIAFLEQPVRNMVSMLAPYFKLPVEMWSNKSMFFTDASGQPSPIETSPQNPTNFLGLDIRGKTGNIMRNIRVLNDLNKLNPGEIFGGEGKPAKFQFPAFSLPGVGIVAPAQESKAISTLEDSELRRILNYVLGGQVQKYNPAEQAIYDAWNKKTTDEDMIKTIRKTINTPYGQKLLEQYNESHAEE